MSYGASQYKKTSIETATKPQILILLYEAAIRHIRRAQTAIDEKKTAEKGIAIGKAHDIVNELMTSLDFNIGGEVAKELERLYNYVIEKLMEANFQNKRESLESCQKILENLLDGWKQAVVKLERGEDGVKK